MRILLTGCTGFVGKFTLRELLLRTEPSDLIICLLRAKKDKSAQERWKELQTDSLFYGIDFNKTQFVESDLNHLDSISWDKEPDVVVHAAANVKMLDTYTSLYRDNVMGLEKLCEMCVKWNISRFHLISSCYVHPRSTVGKPELLHAELPQSVFTTDYTYTKYLGEKIANSYSDKMHINIIRLSCVSAPSDWLDAHPTPGAIGHLGILSMALRGKLEILRVPSTMSLSTVPVNIVARSIVDDVLSELGDTSDLGQERVKVKHICANPSSQWNISIAQLCSVMKRLSQKTNSIEILNIGEGEFKTQMVKHWGLRAYTPWGYKSLTFHQELNDFMNKFADGQKFISSLPDDYFPSMSDEQICEQICYYASRGNHQYLLEKGIQKSRIDVFWTSLPDQYIQGQVMFKVPLVFKSKKEAERRFFDCLGAYRPFFTNPKPTKLLYDGTLGPNIQWSATSEDQKTECDIELLGDYTSVKGYKCVGNHALGDGIAFLGLVPRVDSMNQEIPGNAMVQSNVKPRGLSFTQEIQCLVYYIAGFIHIMCNKKDPINETPGSRTIEMSRCSFHKTEGKTFTASLINKSFNVLSSSLERDKLLYCIPAAISGIKERGLSLPENSFVPLMIPWSAKGGSIQEMCLNSKSVKLFAWLMCNLIALSESKWIIDLLTDKVDVIFSSLMGSDRPLKNIDSFHFLGPINTTVPFTIDAMTIGTETFITVASSHEKINAKDISKQLISK